MNKRDLLIEIGTEELPPKALRTLSEAFAEGVRAQLDAASLGYEALQAFATPRRLALLITALDEQGPTKTVEAWGPPLKVAFNDGEPTRAARAFADKHSLSADALKDHIASDGKQDKLCYRSEQPGARTADVVPGAVDKALAALPIPKRMRWGASRAEFVRPVHWVTLVFGEEVVPCTILEQRAGNTTRGHRFHGNRELTIKTPAGYEGLLEEEGKVIADFGKRRQLVAAQVQAAGRELGGHAVIDEDLLEEVTALVEWPVALAGSFEKRFLDVPAEALISSMKEHQKYFHVEDREGHLLPHFITVANIESTDPQQVIEGNERVIRPRLADAAFFYETDCKHSLEAQREQLKNIVFQEKLGTVYDKTERVAALAKQLAQQLGADTTLAERAGQLCKSDLVTEMVTEFADMQGIAGYYYANNDGEDREVAMAMREQYMPRFAGDALPSTTTGNIVALADRLDTITGIFGIGQSPSGSKDPFGLRRACLGVLRIIIEKQLALDLRTLLDSAIAQHRAVTASDKLTGTILDYMIERLRAVYDEQGIAVEVFMAVTAKGLSQPLDIDKRVRAVHSFNQLSEAQALAAANKRVSNILAKSDITLNETVDKTLLSEAAEQALDRTVDQAGTEVTPLFAAAEYEQGLKALAHLRDTVDAFFDQVMVNVEDEALRRNRLTLLNRLRELFLQVADISLLVPSKN